MVWSLEALDAARRIKTVRKDLATFLTMTGVAYHMINQGHGWQQMQGFKHVGGHTTPAAVYRIGVSKCAKTSGEHSIRFSALRMHCNNLGGGSATQTEQALDVLSALTTCESGDADAGLQVLHLNYHS